MDRPRVIIADDHRMVAEAIRGILEPTFQLERVVTDGIALLEAVDESHPDIVILDIGMAPLNGIELTRRLREKSPAPKVIVLTQYRDRRYVEAAFEAGASAFVPKHESTLELIRAIHEILAGRSYVTPSLSEFQGSTENRAAELTSRQTEVLRLVAEGRSAKEIAGQLKVSPKTVEFHKAAIMDRLGIRTTAELTRYAIRIGLIPE